MKPRMCPETSPRRRIEHGTWKAGVGVAVVLLLTLAATGGASAGISGPAGFIRLEVPAQGSLMASLPFDPFDGSLDTMFINQLQGAAEESSADRVLVWDAGLQAYLSAFKADLTGDPSLDGRWFESGTNWTPASVVLEAGMGLWMENRHAAQPIFLCGGLWMPTLSTSFDPGLHAFGQPFPVAVPLAQAGFAEQGATGASASPSADHLICPLTQADSWLFREENHPLDNQWLTGGDVSETVIQPGRGYWYSRAGSNAFTWTVARPSSDVLYNGGPDSPEITGMAPSPNLDAMDLTLECTGQEGEMLEIFFQDFDPGGSFDPAGPWFVAEEGLATTGRVQWVWRDAGGNGRPAPSAAHARIYVVGRQDIDSDGDGLSDGRERLVHGTDPLLADTDGDGLTDVDEIHVHGTEPLLADTSGDGLSDGDLAAWGMDPRFAFDTHAVPWFCGFEGAEGFEAGPLSGQGGWNVPFGSAVIGPHAGNPGGYAAVLRTGSNGESACMETFVIHPSNSVVWTDLRIQMIPGPLPAAGPEFARLSAVIRMDSSRALAGYDGAAQQWVVASNAPRAAPGAWLHLTVKRDYAAKTWSLYRDGVPLFQDLGFADPATERSALIRVEGGCTTGAGLDDLSATLEMPAHIDDDADGIPNEMEAAIGTNPYVSDTDGDGMDDGREIDWGFDPLASNAFARLPWAADFETAEGYAAGALDGQAGWEASPSVLVQSARADHGLQAVKLQPVEGPGAEMTCYHGAAGEPVAWFETRAWLRPGALPDPAAFAGAHAALFAVNEHGRPCAYDSDLGQWRVAPPLHAVRPGEWTRIAVRLDYRLREWCLYINQVRVFRNVPFLDDSVRSLSRVQVRIPTASSATPAVYVDDMSVQATAPDNLDSSGDGIPDSWAIAHGFDPSASIAHLDSNGDGLTNYENYLHGTDPWAWDTSGDGVSDYAAIHLFHVDPSRAWFNGGRTTNLVVDGASAEIVAGAWTPGAGGSLQARVRNGIVQYTLPVVPAGTYGIVFEVEQANALTAQEWFELSLAVNGRPAGRQTVRAPRGAPAEVLFVAPQLDAGTHTFTLQWHNTRANTFLSIRRVSLVEIDGVDADENGIPDWIEARREQAIRVHSPQASLVSPACLQGDAPHHDSLTVDSSAAAPEEEIAVRSGPGRLWYANVPLASGGTTVLHLQDDRTGCAVTQEVAWTETNLLPESGEPLVIRTGDALRLIARPEGQTQGAVDIEIVGVTNYATTADVPVAHVFDIPGDHVVNAQWTHQGQSQSATALVRVVRAAFAGNPVCRIGQLRDWHCPDLPPDVLLERDSSLFAELEPAAAAGSLIRLGTLSATPRHLWARLGTDGPVFDSAQVTGLYGDNGSYWSVVGTLPDGSCIIEVQLALGHVPPSLVVELHIFVGGVVFEDGTIDKTLVAADFDERGVAVYRFIQSPESMTSVCHTTSLYDGDVLIGGR